MVDASEIARAVDLLRASELVAFPTETVYGLGADATNPIAMRRLYATKGRPVDHPVIAHVGEAGQFIELGTGIPQWAIDLGAAIWPGPLTIVVERREGVVCDEVTAGRPTVGVRVPNHPVALALLAAIDRPIAAPSANRFGRVSPTTAEHVRADLGDDVALILDGGSCGVGVESTIVDASGTKARLLRLGGISEARLTEVTGLTFALADRGEVAAPGTLASHYAPECRVELVTIETLQARASELAQSGTQVGVLGLSGSIAKVGSCADLTVLDAPQTVEEFAAVLYQRLRDADLRHVERLLVIPPPVAGIGAAVCDRLLRAATVLAS